jgi:hypothetical protein
MLFIAMEMFVSVKRTSLSQFTLQKMFHIIDT